MLVPKLSIAQEVKTVSLGSIEKVRLVWRTVENPTGLLVSLCLRRSPWRIRFRDGTSDTVVERRQLYALVHRKLFPYGSRLITYFVRSLGRVVIVWSCGESTGEEVLGREIYAKFPVKGRTVIDVGANIGDSAIYFAMRGAKRVIAFETELELCKVASQNSSLNGVENVSIHHARVSGSPEKLGPTLRRVMRERKGFSACKADGHPKPERVTLDRILDDLDDDEISLKIDCEGCEYEVLLSTRPELLRRVKHIQLEYHFGPDILKKYLELLGYKVRTTKPKYSLLLPERTAIVFGDLWADLPD